MKHHAIAGLPGYPQMDVTLRQVISGYEQAYPGQIVAYYIEGSYADQTALATSDLDLVIVFRRPFAQEADRRAAEQLWTPTPACPQEPDITVVDEASFQQGIRPNLKLGARLLYGEDVCKKYPLLPIVAWARERMHATYWLLISIYQRPTPVRLPLDFPAPGEEFYGYTRRTLQLPNGQEVPCTRNLVRTTGWAATALLALQASHYVARKRECARSYREQIGDEWSSLLEEIDHFCRDEWQYLIPAEPHARQRLRNICERVLAFERYFLTCYRSYLLAQLRSSEPEPVRFARWVQQQLPLDDAEIRTILQAPDL